MADLHMHSLRLQHARLFEFARRRHLPIQSIDLGYIVHCALRELFGESAPAPFFVSDERGAFAKVLGYAAKSNEELVRDAATFADPSVHEIPEKGSHASKRLPEFESGQRLGFEVRTLAVVRLGRGATKRLPGHEADAFLAEVSKVGPDVKVDREAVYRNWFLAQIARLGGASVVGDPRIASYQRVRFTRRTQGESRMAHGSEQPAVTFTGTLEVTDPIAFGNLLARGIGRHRAFGFGMMLLKRPA